MRHIFVFVMFFMTLSTFAQRNITVDMPEFATVRITADSLPTTKTSDVKGWLTFDDGRGNQFEKRVVINAQGNSSLHWPKKNLSVLFCEDEWVGDSTSNITIGDWVKQDEFHLKANYTEPLRGACAIGYRIYDDIVATLPAAENRPWKRAGLKGDDNQLCHPEGFPCAVYFNDEFYGVFSWQLKKHRTNMNMKKSRAEHIHLDGTLWDESLFGGKIDWTQFEVKNPKYSATDSIAPIVTRYIESLSHIKAQHDSLVATGATVPELKAFISDRFDMTSLIDYYLFSLTTGNYDGFVKNWQWITYDGYRWAVEPYDLDGLFGFLYTGNSWLTPEWGMVDDDYTYEHEYINFGPLNYVLLYFMDEARERYKELRQSGALSPEQMLKRVNEWTSAIPSNMMEAEWKRWPDCDCTHETIENPGWKRTDDFTGWMTLPVYDDATTYHKGDRVIIDRGWHLDVFEAQCDIQGVFPFQTLGYTFTLDKLSAWLDGKFSLIDKHLAYSVDGIEGVKSKERRVKNFNYYDLLGRRATNMSKGMYIRYGKKSLK